MLHRRTARAQEQAQLATVGEQIEGQEHDWDEEILSSEEEGLVYFDGAHGSPIWQELLYCAMLCCAALCFASCHVMSCHAAVLKWRLLLC